MEEALFEIGRRTRTLPAPPAVVWDSLTNPYRPDARPWLTLLSDEVEPRVLEGRKPALVVWSSIWPTTPEQVIRLELEPAAVSDTALTWILTSPFELPSKAVGYFRFRLNHLFWEDLRSSYGN